MKEFTDKAKNKIEEKLSLAPNYISGLSLIEIYSNKKLRIENHMGLIKYTTEQILFKAKGGTVTIRGKELFIEAMLPEEIYVSGVFDQIKFDSEEA